MHKVRPLTRIQDYTCADAIFFHRTTYIRSRVELSNVVMGEAFRDRTTPSRRDYSRCAKERNIIVFLLENIVVGQVYRGFW